MQHDPLTMFCYTDLSGQVRGKGFPTRQIEKRLTGGIGWTPNNLMFTALGTLAPGEWGSHGDVTLMADKATGVEVDFGDGTPAERFYLCDVQNTDGTPWDCCTRTLLRDATAELLAETGLTVKATFGQEFIYSGANSRTADNYALDAVRRHGAFGETCLGALHTAGIEVDSYLAEFGPGQFEVTVPPQDALAACDAAHPFGIGQAAGQFLSGIVRHMPALCAFTAPSPVSYLRLVSHSRTGVWSNVGVRDREAGLRIRPTFGTSPEAVARQFNFEYRAADATANPYLQLAVILRAELAGIRDALPSPQPTVEEDPETMPPEALTARQIMRLPSSAQAALAALMADPVAGLSAATALSGLYRQQAGRNRPDAGLDARRNLPALCRSVLRQRGQRWENLRAMWPS